MRGAAIGVVLLWLMIYYVRIEGLPIVQVGGVRYGSTRTAKEGIAAPEEQIMTQKLDHFDKQSQRTFQQRYFVNSDYFEGGDIVFLCVGGEGPPLDATVVTTSVHCSDAVELAKETGALVVALEHRYYGKSLPFGERWVTSEMQWLSSQQALADLAAFHAFITEHFHLPDDAKWVTWGGSYPGMLAGWARLKYPHLFMAAVSSSSPVQALLDFEEYNHAVRDSMADEMVGGSEACAEAIEVGHAIIGEMLQTEEGIAALVERFELCGPEALNTLVGQKVFAGDGVVQFPVQENDPSCAEELCNIEKICAVMTDESIGCEVRRLAYVRKALRRRSNREDMTHAHTQAQAAATERRAEEKHADDGDDATELDSGDVANGNSDGAGNEGCEDLQGTVEAAVNYPTDVTNPDRAWLYQTCSEFGFYMPCLRDGCPYTKGLHTLQDDLDMCWKAFGISAEEVTSAVSFSNNYYGGRSICTSRTFFPNGDIDPWSREGVLSTPCTHTHTHAAASSSSSSVKVLMVRGSSHHFWTHTPLETDSEEVREARSAIWQAVKSWLREEGEGGGGGGGEGGEGGGQMEDEVQFLGYYVEE